MSGDAVEVICSKNYFRAIRGRRGHYEAVGVIVVTALLPRQDYPVQCVGCKTFFRNSKTLHHKCSGQFIRVRVTLYFCVPCRILLYGKTELRGHCKLVHTLHYVKILDEAVRIVDAQTYNCRSGHHSLTFRNFAGFRDHLRVFHGDNYPHRDVRGGNTTICVALASGALPGHCVTCDFSGSTQDLRTHLVDRHSMEHVDFYNVRDMQFAEYIAAGFVERFGSRVLYDRKRRRIGFWFRDRVVYVGVAETVLPLYELFRKDPRPAWGPPGVFFDVDEVVCIYMSVLQTRPGIFVCQICAHPSNFGKSECIFYFEDFVRHARTHGLRHYNEYVCLSPAPCRCRTCRQCLKRKSRPNGHRGVVKKPKSSNKSL